MGKDDKEDSGFGFKDRAKAEDTLRLLQQHDLNYRRLTVRGLLGRAKRVLSMTKAEDKIKNIKEAMEVFEQWLAELSLNKDSDSGKKSDKSPKKEAKKETKKKEDSSSDKDSSSDAEMADKDKKPDKAALPADTVPGLGFKDEETATSTLKELEGRDPDYQRLAVKGLIGRAKRVLTCTRDETKLTNIKGAISIFEQFLDDFESQHLSRQNNPYLSLGLVNAALGLAVESATETQKSFIAAYEAVRGEYKRLRTVAPPGERTWDIVRNDALRGLKDKYADVKLFTDKDEPTAEHLDMILWAYSPEPARLKKCLPENKPAATHSESTRKRRSSAADEESAKRARD